MPAPWVIVPRVEACSDSFTVVSSRRRPSTVEAQLLPVDAARCVGSKAGWLALVTYVPGQHVVISLANPITDARIELPALPFLRLVPRPEDLDLMLDIAVRKVAFAPRPAADDYSVVCVCRGTKVVLHTAARHGRHWRALRPRDGKFYYMDTRGHRGLWALDVRAESDATERRLESELDVLWDKSIWLMPCLN